MGMTDRWSSVGHDASAKPRLGAVRRRDGRLVRVRALAPATVIGLLAGPTGPRLAGHQLAIAAVAAAWIYLMFTRLPPPRQAHRLQVGVFFVGLLVLASILMLRQPLFFIS